MVVKHPVSDKVAQNFIDHYYYDRGMMKWHGFMLSDHVASLKQVKHHKIIQKQRRQNHDVLLKAIEHAASSHRAMIAQINIYERDHFDLYGVILGMQHGIVFINSSDAVVRVKLSDVENVRMK
ncbi:hypothetical protein WR164_15540 [Philodulcilactobacillus myokoensis]|uniref:DNA-directed RNA polymerase beta subunit n=1 Tax=Philodulcilactobacillus myokoensis TaxID=2929573 RepID=A0A9W6B2A0_9LACO|nr:hypothetical protein [Philodulcilactobacillus myokoensis]GLB47575.1 hypothetical protein WR164_15540 [Philodulcilactobacillus myokoensis]